MLKVIDTPPWTTAATDLAQRMERGDRVGMRLVAGRDRFLAQVLREAPSALYVFVPKGVDQAERVLLAMGSALGPDAADEIDRRLRTGAETVQPAFEFLERALGDRPVVVDGWDCLGFAAIDRELRVALGDRGRQVRNWLAHRPGLLVAEGPLPPGAPIQAPPSDVPTALSNGTVWDTTVMWERFGHDVSAYGLALAAMALGAEEEELQELSADGLRGRVIELLPAPGAELLAWLAVHGRPLARTHVPDTVADSVVRLGLDLGLWSEVQGGLVVADAWADWVVARWSAELRRRVHQQLANRFVADFKLDDPSAGQAGLSILEAHRHLVSAGDHDRAREYARYGASLLVEAAREGSLAHDFVGAAQLYGQILTADELGRTCLEPRLRSYVRHYHHFNRAHGKLEDFPATEAGYRRALEDWPENALFWSRLVRLLCYQDRGGAALDALAEAQRHVPEHPQKQTFLIARTVRRLLKNGCLHDAIRVWGTYQPDTPTASEVSSLLREKLAAGWSSQRFTFDPASPLVFERPVDARVVVAKGGWLAELPALSLSAPGPSPLQAMQALVTKTRAELERLVRAHTSDLSPPDRLRKRLLSGVVDVRASQVDAPAPDTYWVYGKLQREGSTLWLRTGGDLDQWFEVPPQLAEQLTVDKHPHLARIGTDDRGIPTGPVVELQPGFRGSDEDLWQAWRKLMADGG